jgi:hypothetical protein
MKKDHDDDILGISYLPSFGMLSKLSPPFLWVLVQGAFLFDGPHGTIIPSSPTSQSSHTGLGIGTPDMANAFEPSISFSTLDAFRGPRALSLPR